MRSLVLLAVLPACTLYTGDDDDGAPVPLVCDQELDTVEFRIDVLDVPATSQEAVALGWDLDDDGTIDNQGGSIIAAIDQALDVDLQGAVEEALVGDLVQIAIRLDSCGEPDFSWFSLIRGAEIDRTSEPPSLAGDDVTEQPAVHTGVALPVVATGGITRFPVGQLIHPVADDWIDATRFVIELDASEGWDVARGRMRAALDAEQTFAVVTRAFQAKVVERQQELGPCTPEACDDVLRTLLEVFDTDSDGGVDLAEVRSNSLMRSLLAADLDLDGDGAAEHFSIGVGFRASWVLIR